MENIIITSDNMKAGQHVCRAFMADIVSTLTPGLYEFKLNEGPNDLYNIRFKLGPSTTISHGEKTYIFHSYYLVGCPSAVHILAWDQDADRNTPIIVPEVQVEFTRGSRDYVVENASPLAVTCNEARFHKMHFTRVLNATQLGDPDNPSFIIWKTAHALKVEHFDIGENSFVFTPNGSYKVKGIAQMNRPCFLMLQTERCPVPPDYPMTVPYLR